MVAGTGKDGSAAASSGNLEYIGSDTPSPANSAGGLGMMVITLPGLNPAIYYDVYFSAKDRFGQMESKPRWRRLASLGVATPAASLSVAEGDAGDVIILQLTQPPTEVVSVTLGALLQVNVGQVLFAQESNTLAWGG